MLKKDHINIIISGIGGQGVFSLTKVLWNLSANAGLNCQGATFKGGAQKAGSIHSEMRIFLDKNIDHENHSNQIRKGTLDLIIGLEPWETLRYMDYFNKETKVIMNTKAESLYVERYSKEKFADPVEQIKEQLKGAFSFDFSEAAKQLFSDHRMVNYLMLMEAIKIGHLPFNAADAKKEFIQVINPKEEIVSKIKLN